jgi:hypothetical protein
VEQYRADTDFFAKAREATKKHTSTRGLVVMVGEIHELGNLRVRSTFLQFRIFLVLREPCQRKVKTS